MSEVTAFNAYNKFIALKQHFNSTSYDFFKYKGKVRSNLNTFKTKRDRFFFEKVSRKYEGEELILFYVSNLIKNRDVWIGELARNVACEKTYLDWKKTKQSLTYQFQSDILSIKSSMNHLHQVDQDFNQLFITRVGEYPQLFDFYNEGTISLETIIGIDVVLGCFRYWDRVLSGDIIWDDFYHMCLKYTPFLNYNVKQRNKFKEILWKEFASVI